MPRVMPFRLQGGAAARFDFGHAARRAARYLPALCRAARFTHQCDISLFGIVSNPADTLDATQSRPHYDHALPCSFAVLHYVNPGQFGGTGFFRHVPSGFELITSDNQKDYHRSVYGFLSEHGLPQGYDMTQQDHYKLLDAVDYHTNRLLIYPSGLLHSGLINPPEDLSPDPALGRLTSSIFINFYAPDAAAS